MPLPPSLISLSNYLTGEFDNREQAIAEPAWYVHLRLWHRPVSLFQEDSYTLFAEQANVLKLDQPYRQRLIRLQAIDSSEAGLHAQYYAFKDPSRAKGAGQTPALLQTLTLDEIEALPGCLLSIQQAGVEPASRFVATPPPDCRCYFSYQGETRQVVLGFEASAQEFFSYDKGVEPDTGKALWGAIMGPYQFIKRTGFS